LESKYSKEKMLKVVPFTVKHTVDDWQKLLYGRTGVADLTKNNALSADTPLTLQAYLDIENNTLSKTTLDHLHDRVKIQKDKAKETYTIQRTDIGDIYLRGDEFEKTLDISGLMWCKLLFGLNKIVFAKEPRPRAEIKLAMFEKANKKVVFVIHYPGEKTAWIVHGELGKELTVVSNPINYTEDTEKLIQAKGYQNTNMTKQIMSIFQGTKEAITKYINTCNDTLKNSDARDHKHVQTTETAPPKKVEQKKQEAPKSVHIPPPPPPAKNAEKKVEKKEKKADDYAPSLATQKKREQNEKRVYYGFGRDLKTKEWKYVGEFKLVGNSSAIKVAKKVANTTAQTRLDSKTKKIIKLAYEKIAVVRADEKNADNMIVLYYEGEKVKTRDGRGRMSVFVDRVGPPSKESASVWKDIIAKSKSQVDVVQFS
jgi:hypothetical protein